MSPSIQGFSSEKVVLSDSGGKYAQIKHRLQAKIVKTNMCLDFWCERQQETFSLEEA